MSDFKTEVERVKQKFNDADVRKRNVLIGCGVALFVIFLLVIFA